MKEKYEVSKREDVVVRTYEYKGSFNLVFDKKRLLEALDDFRVKGGAILGNANNPNLTIDDMLDDLVLVLSQCPGYIYKPSYLEKPFSYYALDFWGHISDSEYKHLEDEDDELSDYAYESLKKEVEEDQ